MRSILIKNGRIWNGNDFFCGDIFIDGGRVVKIADSIDCDAFFTYDANGNTVSAGFVDIHTHMKGISPDIYGICIDAVCLPFGVTTAADAGASMGDDSLLDSFAVDSFAYAFAEIKNNSVLTDSLDKRINAYGKRLAGLKISFDTTGGEIYDINPLREACEISRRLGLPLTVHTSSSPVSMLEIVKELKRGDILTHSFHGGANTSVEDDCASLRLAREKGVVIDAGLAGYVHTDFGVFAKAVESGYSPDVISTDITCASAFMRGGRYGMTMCMSVAREVGMSEENIFRAVTSTPARVLGAEAGRLFEGCVADLCVIGVGESFSLTDKEGNTVQSDNGYKCLLTVKNGQILYRY
ncbi:MAG: amidohydrolase family protein [Clostridia bacterium]|nr:amidohydrolase family protein [Clostridia bacterium]